MNPWSGLQVCRRPAVGTCQQEAPNSKAVLCKHQNREHQQRVQLQVGAVDRLHAVTTSVAGPENLSDFAGPTGPKPLARRPQLNPTSRCNSHR